MTGLRGLKSKLMEVKAYLAAVLDGRLPINHEIMRDLQEMFNLLPNLNVSELNRAFAVESNDMMLVIYVASLIRSVIALHNLIENKETRVAAEKKMAAMVVGSSKQIGVGGGDKENGNKENGTGDEKKKMDSGK